MIILGVILIIVGVLLGISILYTLGIILAVIGVALYVLAHFGHGRGLY